MVMSIRLITTVIIAQRKLLRRSETNYKARNGKYTRCPIPRMPADERILSDSERSAEQILFTGATVTMRMLNTLRARDMVA
jgi:hypothetical protein